MRKVTLLKFLFAGITVCVTLYGTLLLRDYVIGLAGALAIIFLFIYSVVEKRSMRLFLDFIKTSWSASTTKEAKKAAIELIGRDNAEFIEEISPQFVDTVRGLFSKYMSSLKTIGDWIDATLEEASRIRHSTEEFKRKGQESLEASRKILENLDEIKNKIREYLEVGHSLYEKIMERQGESEEILSNLELIASDFEKLATDLVSVFDELFNYWGMLGTSINEISSVTDEISRISKRTSILALNASMEATRAGDVGKGFAVVAENIQKLDVNTKKMFKNC
ncbi:MAG TPA: hypothetical protein ENL09_04550 [Bacteroidetes bacterium]|nr:hypothetical protein [Bacteroidota bacterium]